MVEPKLVSPRFSIDLRLEGVGAHVRTLEKQFDGLRIQYSGRKTQCNDAGLNFTREQFLSVCVKAKNSLLLVGRLLPCRLRS